MKGKITDKQLIDLLVASFIYYDVIGYIYREIIIMNLYRQCRLFCYAGFLLIMVTAAHGALANAPARNYYQLKIYHYKSQAQENKIEAYLQKAYLPALHRAGIIRVGVFKPVDQQDTDRRIYVFTPFPSLDKLVGMDQQLGADDKYISDSKDYADAGYGDAPYSRIEIIVLQAFPGMPSPAVPCSAPLKPTGFMNCAAMRAPRKSIMRVRLICLTTAMKSGFLSGLDLMPFFTRK